ncbi:MAG: tetratricopeptide repeat protein, partial [Acidobacteria bacterium]|nr:tetratricopeptide repeat protein [Acidobacteriota bacterium]
QGPLNTDDNMLIEFRAPLRMLARQRSEQEAQARELASMFVDGTTGIARQVRPSLDRELERLFWARLARASVGQGYPDVAGLYAGRALALGRDPMALRAASEVLALGGRTDEARVRLEAAAREFPRDADLLRSLAELERTAADWPAVRRHAQALVALEPGDRQARFRLGESLVRLGEHRAAAAALSPLAPDGWRGGATRPAAPDGDFPELGLMLGSSLHQSGRSEAAVAPLRGHLRAHPGDREARELLASALERAGRLPEARAERRCLQPDAARQAADRLERAVVAWNAAPPDRLRALLQDARELDSGNDAIALLLARTHARLGDRRAASALLEEFLEAHPDRAWAIGFLGELDAEGGDPERGRLLAERYVALTGRAWDPIQEPTGRRRRGSSGP